MLRLNIGRGSSLRQECEERRKNNRSLSSQLQWYATFCCCLGAGLTMSTTIAFNSLLVSSLQHDPALNLSFEEASWIGRL